MISSHQPAGDELQKHLERLLAGTKGSHHLGSASPVMKHDSSTSSSSSGEKGDKPLNR